MEHFFLTSITLLLGAGACYSDLRHGKIPNKLTFSFILGGFAANLILGGGRGAILSAEGFALGFALLFVPYLMGGVGAGDVKLLAAVGALQGPCFVGVTALAGALAGGCLALMIYRMPALCYGGRMSMANLHLVRTDPATNRPVITYGLAIFAGMIFAVWYFM